MTEAKIKEIIEELFKGEYGPDHDFESRYDVWQKNEFFESMLGEWDCISSEGKKLIAEAIRGHIEFYWCHFEPIGIFLAKHGDKAEIVEAVRNPLRMGLLSLELLHALKNAKEIPSQWLIEIEEHQKKRSFKETEWDTDIEKMYRQIEKALKVLRSERNPQHKD